MHVRAYYTSPCFINALRNGEKRKGNSGSLAVIIVIECISSLWLNPSFLRGKNWASPERMMREEKKKKPFEQNPLLVSLFKSDDRPHLSSGNKVICVTYFFFMKPLIYWNGRRSKYHKSKSLKRVGLIAAIYERARALQLPGIAVGIILLHLYLWQF